jgi:hypothetical protein
VLLGLSALKQCWPFKMPVSVKSTLTRQRREPRRSLNAQTRRPAGRFSLARRRCVWAAIRPPSPNRADRDWRPRFQPDGGISRAETKPESAITAGTPVSKPVTSDTATATGTIDALRRYLQPHRAHQFERVAFFDNTRAQPVVEAHPTVLELVFKMEIGPRRLEFFGNSRQRQIVRGHQS